MNAPHAGFIFAAYAITFVLVGVTVLAINLRDRSLRRALSTFHSSEEDWRDRA